MEIAVIAALADDRVIGKGNRLPWNVPADQRFFHQQIRDTHLLTGRRSWESPQGQRLFPGRPGVIVLTRQAGFQAAGAEVAHSVEEAVETARRQGARRLGVLGGGEVYRAALPLADLLIITEIHGSFDGDAYFPPIEEAVWLEAHREDFPPDAENAWPYSFVFYRKREKTT